jgi:RNA polymerase sigma-70 factor (ECF subfamily)
MAAPPGGFVRLRSQDPHAFGALVDRQYEAVRRYLTRLTGDPEVAAELTQETFLRAYQALPRLADDSNVPGWLFRIATNLARQHHRRRRRLCWVPLEADHTGGQNPADEVVRRDRVRLALAELPFDQRTCLLLYAWTGYSCAEIGEILDRSAPAVRMLLVRARRRFRSAYAALGEFGDLDDDLGLGGGTAPAAGTTPAGGAPAAPSAGRAGSAGAVGHGSATGRRATSGAGSASREAGARGSGDRPCPRDFWGGGSALTMRAERDSCRDVAAVLPFYPRGDLRRDAFGDVTRHLADCLPCRLELADVQRTYRLLQRHLNTAEVGDSGAARAAILARVRALAASLPVPEPVPIHAPFRSPRR